MLPISILTTPNENWGRKVGVVKNLGVYDNGKDVEIEKDHFHNTCSDEVKTLYTNNINITTKLHVCKQQQMASGNTSIGT